MSIAALPPVSLPQTNRFQICLALSRRARSLSHGGAYIEDSIKLMLDQVRPPNFFHEDQIQSAGENLPRTRGVDFAAGLMSEPWRGRDEV